MKLIVFLLITLLSSIRFSCAAESASDTVSPDSRDEAPVIKQYEVKDNPDIRIFRSFYPNGQVQKEMRVDIKNKKALRYTIYDEKGKILESGEGEGR